MSVPDEATAQPYKKSYEEMLQFFGIRYRARIPIKLSLSTDSSSVSLPGMLRGAGLDHKE